MSLRTATLPVSATGTKGAVTEQRPRLLHQPDSKPDATQENLGKSGKLAAAAENEAPYTKPHGNARPQEPSFHRRWGSKQAVDHPHEKPWSISSCPGKRESPEGTNRYHRVWLLDTSTQRPRWNRERKREYYAKQDQDLMSKVPHDECCFRGNQTNHKLWTHLVDGGEKGGGQQEKLDYQHKGPNSNNGHIYKGKFSNVKHSQKILRRRGDGSRRTGLSVDRRPKFDTRMHDDIARATVEKVKWEAQSAFDTHRPKNTMSCPQLGADFVNY